MRKFWGKMESILLVSRELGVCPRRMCKLCARTLYSMLRIKPPTLEMRGKCVNFDTTMPPWPLRKEVRFRIWCEKYERSLYYLLFLWKWIFMYRNRSSARRTIHVQRHELYIKIFPEVPEGNPQGTHANSTNTHSRNQTPNAGSVSHCVPEMNDMTMTEMMRTNRSQLGYRINVDTDS